MWQDTFVGDAVLKVAIREIREALSDNPKTPLFIETAHRRGYRFIGRLGAGAAIAVPARADQRHEVPQAFVGREHALHRLRQHLEHVRSGTRRVVFVTGEAGIGKTALLDAFASGVVRTGGARLCSGQCLEQYGMSEAYLPVLDAIRQLCRDDTRAVNVLRLHAPMWLMQMPSLISSADREALGRRASGATPGACSGNGRRPRDAGGPGAARPVLGSALSISTRSDFIPSRGVAAHSDASRMPGP